jgi:hypothetical protein
MDRDIRATDEHSRSESNTQKTRARHSTSIQARKTQGIEDAISIFHHNKHLSSSVNLVTLQHLEEERVVVWQ